MNLATNWNTLEVQEQLEAGLKRMGPGSGFTADELLPIMRWAAVFGALASMAGIVFAIHTAKRHRPSRIALSILSALGIVVFTLGGLAGFLPAAMLLLVLIMLWNAPARAWFAHADPATPGEDESPSRAVLPPPPSTSSPVGHEQPATPVTRAVSPAGWEPLPPAPSSRMPKQLTLALIVTAMGSAFVLLVSLLLLLATTVLREQILVEIAKDERMVAQLEALGSEPEAMLQLMLVASSGWAVLSVFGLLAVGLAFMRKPFARVLLLLAAGCTAVAGVVAFPVGLVATGLAGYVVFLLTRGEVRAWFAKDSAPRV